ncbi:uncharacterized protein QC763_0077600 [Podospora pseudopauciseta]|uniref:Uncharacterized protein n=3 Tax=Podospora TaxID=5144 RepID=A0ABR0HAR5_9PEZI|nr:hypothetical protein QC761_0086360 [Podospora bellae-mahoneyi]KAK4665102.1 hypothetical protein QC763_0077600 [Podospora pseudopauciseta]KAK4676256.1 hypothetical protein QC764_0086540 [Podospora pseudoanserina]
MKDSMEMGERVVLLLTCCVSSRFWFTLSQASLPRTNLTGTFSPFWILLMTETMVFAILEGDPGM